MTETRNIAQMLERHLTREDRLKRHLAREKRLHLAREERLHKNLLAPNKHWGPTDKANICVALRADLITRDEVMAAHNISAVELDDWLTRYDTGGKDAFKVKQLPGRAA